LVSEQLVCVGSQVPEPLAVLHENPVGHWTLESQVSGTQTLLRQVADSRPVLADEQSESLVQPAPSQSPLTHALPAGQSAAVLHCAYGEQKPLRQGIESGHVPELVQACRSGKQKKVFGPLGWQVEPTGHPI
jgi:hypothetical protein